MKFGHCSNCNNYMYLKEENLCKPCYSKKYQITVGDGDIQFIKDKVQNGINIIGMRQNRNVRRTSEEIINEYIDKDYTVICFDADNSIDAGKITEDVAIHASEDNLVNIFSTERSAGDPNYNAEISARVPLISEVPKLYNTLDVTKVHPKDQTVLDLLLYGMTNSSNNYYSYEHISSYLKNESQRLALSYSSNHNFSKADHELLSEGMREDSALEQAIHDVAKNTEVAQKLSSGNISISDILDDKNSSIIRLNPNITDTSSVILHTIQNCLYNEIELRSNTDQKIIFYVNRPEVLNQFTYDPHTIYYNLHKYGCGYIQTIYEPSKTHSLYLQNAENHIVLSHHNIREAREITNHTKIHDYNTITDLEPDKCLTDIHSTNNDIKSCDLPSI